MLKKTDHFHGSDLEKIEAQYGIAKDAILPFGSNVNPLGISPLAKEALIQNVTCIQDYPDRDYRELRQAISLYAGTNPAHTVVGGGSTELIRLFIELVNPEKTLIIDPTYSEYARDIGLNHGEIVSYHLKEENDFKLDPYDFLIELEPSVDLLVICNPNNPTSTAIPAEHLGMILRKCREYGIFVMVDETYIEFTENMSDITAVPLIQQHDNLVVIRGVSKFFASPGLRLGYALCSNQDMLEKIEANKNPWSINTFAIVAGKVMFSDEDYIKETKNLMKMEKNLIMSALSARKTIKLFEPEANFILVKLLKPELTSADVFEHCIKKGVMIRDCSDFNGLSDKFIRFCIMNPQDNDLLVNTLLEIV